MRKDKYAILVYDEEWTPNVIRPEYIGEYVEAHVAAKNVMYAIKTDMLIEEGGSEIIIEGIDEWLATNDLAIIALIRDGKVSYVINNVGTEDDYTDGGYDLSFLMSANQLYHCSAKTKKDVLSALINYVYA